MSLFWAKPSSKLLKWLGKKVVLIVHGGSIPAGMKVNPRKYLSVLHIADKVICPSLYILETLKNYDIESDLIENVVNLKEYTFQPKEKFQAAIF